MVARCFSSCSICSIRASCSRCSPSKMALAQKCAPEFSRYNHCVHFCEGDPLRMEPSRDRRGPQLRLRQCANRFITSASLLRLRTQAATTSKPAAAFRYANCCCIARRLHPRSPAYLKRASFRARGGGGGAGFQSSHAQAHRLRSWHLAGKQAQAQTCPPLPGGGSLASPTARARKLAEGAGPAPAHLCRAVRVDYDLVAARYNRVVKLSQQPRASENQMMGMFSSLTAECWFEGAASEARREASISNCSFGTTAFEPPVLQCA